MIKRMKEKRELKWKMRENENNIQTKLNSNKTNKMSGDTVVTISAKSCVQSRA